MLALGEDGFKLVHMNRKPIGELRKGWTTGACATAATKAALMRLWGQQSPERVPLVLPRGEASSFDIESIAGGADWAQASVIKDAGDDPDVTHGAEIVVRVRMISGSSVEFVAGEGVGRVTKPGLPIPPGEAAVNPVPRQMMTQVVLEQAALWEVSGGVEITISVPGGAELAAKTWNPRLGIVGGISILGTTGIVRPFSCAAWIASIHRGIDVALADGLTHVAGCTGATSERVVQAELGLPDHAMLDMGDFAGGMLKYLAKHPVEKVTIGGGFGKLTKLAQGARDLHSARSQVDFAELAEMADHLGGDAMSVAGANTAMEAVEIVPALAGAVAEAAKNVAQGMASNCEIDVIVISRDGQILGHSS